MLVYFHDQATGCNSYAEVTETGHSVTVNIKEDPEGKKVETFSFNLDQGNQLTWEQLKKEIDKYTKSV